MLAWEELVEAQALRRRGWPIAAIARHLGRSRNTIKAYLRGERGPGVRRRAGADPLERYAAYVAQRLQDDPHLWASTLLDEVRRLGYAGAYSSFTEQLRERGLRPHCEWCHGVKGRPTTEIEHPPGEEIQWDVVKLRHGTLGELFLLNGTLAHSGKVRGAFIEREDQPHLIDGIDRVLRQLGGTARRWRFDRTSAVCDPKTGKLLPSFAAVAQHYGVAVAICPPYRGNRKGVVEKRNHFSAQRWWRTAAVTSVEQAQVDYDRFCAETADTLPRHGRTVAEVAAEEPLLRIPDTPYPAVVEVSRKVGANALVAFRGNAYGVMPELVGAEVTVQHRLGSAHLEILMAADLVARHQRAPDGAGVVRRSDEQRAALETAVLTAFSTRRPCPRKPNRPPSPAALALAAARRPELVTQRVTVSLESYAELVEAAS